MGVPRYLAAAHVDDLERLLRLADELVAQPDRGGHIALLQCGGVSAQAAEVAALLNKARRPNTLLTVKDRDQAQSQSTLTRLAGVSAVWVFADDLFQTFLTVFATQLAFALRANANKGLPVIGVGGGALAVGGLLLANRLCRDARYDLVSGLGWAPRVLVDAGPDRSVSDGAIARSSVQSLPGLLGVDLGVRGGVRVDGGRVDSIGDEPIALLGTGSDGRLLRLLLEPGQVAQIAPPPFAPLASSTLRVGGTLQADARPAPSTLRHAPAGAVIDPNGGRVCPMCHKVHTEPRVELAA